MLPALLPLALIALQVSSKEIVLDGGILPDRTTLRLTAECLGNQVEIALASDREGPSTVTRITVNGVDKTPLHEYQDLDAYLKDVRLSYITRVICNKDRIDIMLAGHGKEGEGLFYRVSLPVPVKARAPR